MTDRRSHLFGLGSNQTPTTTGPRRWPPRSAHWRVSFSTNSKDAALLQSLAASTRAHHRQRRRHGARRAYDAGTGSGSRSSTFRRETASALAPDLDGGISRRRHRTINVLIRASARRFRPSNVPSPLADPKLDLFDASSVRIGGNDNWDATLASTFTAIGAFQLAAGSKDARAARHAHGGKRLQRPGLGVNNATGDALVEIYEVP